MLGINASVVPVVVGALGAVTPKPGEWLQHFKGFTPETSVQKNTILGTAINVLVCFNLFSCRSIITFVYFVDIP